MATKPTYEELENQIIEMKKQLEQSKSYETRMERNKIIGSIAHEFNNLLMGIQGNISLMILDMNINSPFYSKLKDIETNIEGGVKLTEKLLDFINDGVYKPEEIKKSVNSVNMTRIKSELKKPVESYTIQSHYSVPGIHPGVKVYEQVYTGSKTVLLVDDESMIIDVGKQMLEKTGLEVIVARSGAKAVELYQKEYAGIDMVILDLVMPGMDGIETYYQLKQINPDIKVLFSSGYRKSTDISNILSDGKGGFIQKPFKMEQLTKEIGKIMDM